MLIFAAAIRLFEALLFSQVNSNFCLSILWNLTGLCYDISLYLRTGIWLLIAFVGICFFSEKIARILIRIMLSMTLLLSMICVVFFTTSGFLVDKVVFSFSLTEIAITQASTKSSWWVYILIVGTPVLFYFVSSKRIFINHILLVVFIILTLLSFFIFRELSFHSNQYLVKTNKAYFLGKSAFSAFKEFEEDMNDENMVNAVKEFRAYFSKHKFVETAYPFLYQDDCHDVLSPFFNIKKEPPNIVFIIVEGLGYDFFNPVYQLMPFLDSLSKESLLWENCLSVSPRTFGVLPALLGASPLGEKGFMDKCPDNSEFNSLLRILHQNNYTNFFFYGGSMNFDNMGNFARQNNLSYLKEDEWDQDIIEQKLEKQGFVDDHLVYLQALRQLDRMNTSPRADVYLSYFTHIPFKYPQSAYFQNMLKNRIVQNNILSEQEKKEILNAIDMYGSFAYSDWALQQLMGGYKKRDDFENTIFIITGDHSLPAKQFGSYSNYHVPLIIYSPLLKAYRKMKGVVSHRDITPTILSFLQNNYHIKMPAEVTWLNTALDTSLNFNAHIFSPLQLIDHTIGGIVFKNYILCEGILEEINDNVACKINDSEILRKMNRLLFLYRSLDYYAFYNNALIRNQEAYKYKLSNTAIDIKDTIAPESHFAKQSQLKVVEGPLNHKTTLFFDNTCLYPIEFLNFDTPTAVEEFRVEIEFKIYIVKGTPKI
jgi:phosphoglycerol transferase MdoB-like AlkP superfamily enzyme